MPDAEESPVRLAQHNQQNDANDSTSTSTTSAEPEASFGVPGPPGSYAKVDRSHVVSAGYLRNFTRNEQIEIRLATDPSKRVVTSVKNAGVQTGFYKRTRPDGSRIDDIEWSLSHIEDVAAPVIRDIESLWPLDLTTKSMLAEFFGMQLIRGPRWRRWHETFTREYIDEHRRGDAPNPTGEPIGEEALATMEGLLLEDTARLTRMLDLGPKVASVLGSMHWSLVEFPAPILATSDHPVVVWPLAARTRKPEVAPMNTGLLDTLEVRVPVGPRHAILMTWADLKDTDRVRLRGVRHHAAGVNAFTIEQADPQWFCLPGTSPPIAAGGGLLPLSPELMLGYGVDAAVRSRRRATTTQLVSKVVGRAFGARDYQVAWLS